MNPADSPADPSMLMDALAALEPGERAAALNAAGAPGPLLLALAGEVQRVASAEAGRALGLADLLSALADELGDPATRAELRSVRAMALAYAGRFDDALAACEDAAIIAERAGLTAAAARSRLGAVHPLASLGRYEEAIATGRAAREVFAALGSRDLEARAEINLGAVHEMADDPRSALACYDRAARLLDGDLVTLAQLDSNRGLALIALDDYAGAEQAFAAAVERFDREGLGWAAAVAEENLAYLAVRQGRLATAMRHFERGRRYLEEDDAPVHLARLLADQADAYAAIGLPEQALAAWQAVIPELDARGLAAEAVQARMGAGRLLLRVGRLEEAAEMLDAAAASAGALALDLPLARIDALRAELALAAGDLAEAQGLAADALVVLSDRPAEALAPRETLARIALAAGEPQIAIAEIDAAMHVARGLDLPPALADLHHLRARAFQSCG
ncbi:MAG: tetratricopeptide repeat protein, partial [Thermomicrobiales bacterium]